LSVQSKKIVAELTHIVNLSSINKFLLEGCLILIAFLSVHKYIAICFVK